MRKHWLIQEDGIIKIISNRGTVPEYSIGEPDPDCLDPKCYDLFEDEDGTFSALLNENRAADRKNKLMKDEYELRK